MFVGGEDLGGKETRPTHQLSGFLQLDEGNVVASIPVAIIKEFSATIFDQNGGASRNPVDESVQLISIDLKGDVVTRSDAKFSGSGLAGCG